MRTAVHAWRPRPPGKGPPPISPHSDSLSLWNSWFWLCLVFLPRFLLPLWRCSGGVYRLFFSASALLLAQAFKPLLCSSQTWNQENTAREPPPSRRWCQLTSGHGAAAGGCTQRPRPSPAPRSSVPLPTSPETEQRKVPLCRLPKPTGSLLTKHGETRR